MKNIPEIIGSDPIEKVAGLLNTIKNSSTVNDNDLKTALFEIGECLKILKNEIHELKSQGNKK
jgi:hypothetical protein